MRVELTHIADILKNRLGLTEQIRAFAFGSSVDTNKRPNDIDIVIIYVDPLVPQKVRDILEDVTYMPIDLLFLTPEEELETDFIRKQKCISIF